MIFAVIAVVLGGLTYFKSQSPLLGGLVALMMAVGAPHFVLDAA